MKRHPVLLVAALLMAAPIAAHAQTLGNLQWVGTGSSFSSTFQNYSTTSTVTAYAGAAYRANAHLPSTAPWYLQASNGFGPAVDILCIDFLHSALTTTYPAYFTNLAYDDLTRTRGASLENYQRVAWLSTQLETLPFTNAGRQQRTEVHAAIWRIMSGQPRYARANVTGGSFTGSDTRIASWVSLANANYASVNLRHFTVVTSLCVDNVGNEGRGFNVPDNCGQEFLVRDSTVTPEPATMLMLATGLMALVGAGVVGRGGFAA
jgi:hypothetical protein